VYLVGLSDKTLVRSNENNEVYAAVGARPTSYVEAERQGSIRSDFQLVRSGMTAPPVEPSMQDADHAVFVLHTYALTLSCHLSALRGVPCSREPKLAPRTKASFVLMILAAAASASHDRRHVPFRSGQDLHMAR
jgi:hypothetical protein